MDRIAFLLSVAAGALAAYSLFQLARILYRQDRRLAYVWLASIALLVITLLPLAAGRLEGTYLWVAVVTPAGVFALVQIPLIVFRAQEQGGEARKKALLQGWLLILAVVLMHVSGTLEEPPRALELRDSVIFLTQFIGISPLLASSYLLMKAGWRIARPWGVGLNPVTVPAVLPVFVQKYPKEGWPPARRFLIWSAVALGPAFVADALGTTDTLHPLGYLLFTVGGLATTGALAWLLVALAKRQWDAAPRALVTVVVATSVAAAGVLMFGDLVIDRHAATAAARTWADRAFGCAGNQRHATLLIEWSKRPLEPRLRRVPLDAAGAAAAGTHDPAVAVMLAQASTLVYMTPCDMVKTTRSWEIPGLQVIPLGSTQPGDLAGADCRAESSRDQAVILVDGRNIVLAFRGTNQLANWVTNLAFVPKSLIDGEWTHGGFENALDRQWPPILSTLQRVRHKDRALWLTGHSLGGALAVLAALRLERAGIDVQGVYTFGQPLLAGDAIAARLNEQLPGYYRFVMHGDGVPGLGSPGARHAGNLRYIDTLGAIHPRVSLKTDVMDGVCAGPFGPIQSHGMIHYLSTMQLALLEAARRAGRLDRRPNVTR